MMTYGYHIQENDDNFVSLVETNGEGFRLATTPGAFVVNIIPFLQYLPKWFPGMRGYWRTVAYWKRITQRMLDEPVEYVKRQIVSLLPRTLDA